MVSREIKPLHPAVVTIGQFQGGTTHNIIPERAHLKGTVRTLHAEARDTAEAALRRLVAGLETGMRVSCALEYRRLVPALVNDDRVLDLAVRLPLAGPDGHGQDQGQRATAGGRR